MAAFDAPLLLAGLPLRCHGVGSMPSEGFVVACGNQRLVAPLELAPLDALWETASGKGTERRLAPHPTLPYGYATAWVLHNLNRTRTQNACVAFVLLKSGITVPLALLLKAEALLPQWSLRQQASTVCSPTAKAYQVQPPL